MKNSIRLAIVLVLILQAAAILQAGVLVTTIEKHGGDEQPPGKIYFETDRLRMEVSDEDKNQVIIFRKDKDLIWILELADKEYMEMTREDVAKMKKQMDAAMKQMEEQLKNIPPAQREMMMKMMPGNMQATKPPKPVYKKVSSGIKVNKWSCDKYEGYVEGKKTDEVWTTDWSQLGISAEKFSALNAMGEFFEALSGQMEDYMQIGSEEFAKSGGYRGLPVKMIDYSEDVQSIFEIKEVKEQSFDSSLFELPSGFKKKENPMDGMQGYK